jgi:hypothetical protein
LSFGNGSLRISRDNAENLDADSLSTPSGGEVLDGALQVN